MPTSKDSRVRVEGFSKISATLRSLQCPRGERRPLELQRAIEQRVQLGGIQLGSGEEVACRHGSGQSRCNAPHRCPERGRRPSQRAASCEIVRRVKVHRSAPKIAALSLLLAASALASPAADRREARAAASSPQATTATALTSRLQATTTPRYAAPRASAPVQSGTVQIAYRNIAIAPDTLKVKVGTTVRWTNYDPVEHNVTSRGGPPGSRPATSAKARRSRSGSPSPA